MRKLYRLTVDSRGNIFRRNGGQVKKEKLYLVISLVIIIVSGAIIYGLGNKRGSDFGHPAISDDRSQVTVTLIKQISQLKDRLENEPDNYNILVQLGNSYYDLNNPEESIGYYKKALGIRPDSPEVLVDCGNMYRELGMVDSSIELFTRASKLAPDLPQASFNLGAVLLSEKDDPEGAADVWQGFLTKNPGISTEMRDFFQEKIKQAREME
jgi:tetratricopeptide (TPR) repeat protein